MQKIYLLLSLDEIMCKLCPGNSREIILPLNAFFKGFGKVNSLLSQLRIDFGILPNKRIRGFRAELCD